MLLSQMQAQNVVSVNKNVSFSANKNGVDQTGIASGVNTKVTFTNEGWDTNSNYDAPNSRFTPTVAGKYLMSAVSYIGTGINYSGELMLYKNGVLINEGLINRSPS